MEHMDLNINNYNLKDILDLFRLPSNFDEPQLKMAKMTALKTHPDKSGLDPEIFRFFIKAFNVLVKIYKFRKRTESNLENVTYDSNEKLLDKNEKLLDKIKKKPVNEFNSWFNMMFEKVSAGEERRGHGDWLSSEEGVVQETAKNLNDFGRVFNKTKENLKQVIIYDSVQDSQNSSMGSMLNNGEEQVYSSNIFSNSKLRYEDVKVAHTETVVPVSESDFNKRRQFNSVDEFRRYRSSNAPTMLSKEESREMLYQQKMDNEQMATTRAYELLKQEEMYKKKNENWWKHVSLLENK